MEDMHFKDRADLQEYIREHGIKRLGVGREGICTLLDNNVVIKYLYFDYSKDYALQFKDIDVDSFIFSKNAAYMGKDVIALLMEYAQGESVFNRNPGDVNIRALGIQLEKVVSDIMTISKEGILVKDFTCNNVMYDYQQFKIIDTLPYLYFKGQDYTKENIFEIMNRLYGGLFADIAKDGRVRDDFLFYGKREMLEHPREYLEALKSFLEKITDQEVNTLDQARLALKIK